MSDKYDNDVYMHACAHIYLYTYAHSIYMYVYIIYVHIHTVYACICTYIYYISIMCLHNIHPTDHDGHHHPQPHTLQRGEPRGYPIISLPLDSILS